MRGWRLNLLCFGASSFWKSLSQLFPARPLLGRAGAALFLLNSGPVAGKAGNGVSKKGRMFFDVCQALQDILAAHANSIAGFPVVI